MPRGSDAAAAGAELKARTGIQANAEELIAANQARMTRELRAASNRPVDYDATKEMDEKAAQALMEGEGFIVSWAVRGPFAVVVYEDDEGVLHKEAHVRKGQEKQAERAMRTGGATLQERARARGEGEEQHERRPDQRERRPRPSS